MRVREQEPDRDAARAAKRRRHCAIMFAAEVHAPELDRDAGRQIALEEREVGAGADADLEDAHRLLRIRPCPRDGELLEVQRAHVAVAGDGFRRGLQERQEKRRRRIVERRDQVVEEAHQAIDAAHLRLVDEPARTRR